jgi:hypothetical protein
MATLVKPGVPVGGGQDGRTDSCDKHSGVSTEPECDGSGRRTTGYHQLTAEDVMVKEQISVTNGTGAVLTRAL